VQKGERKKQSIIHPSGRLTAGRGGTSHGATKEGHTTVFSPREGPGPSFLDAQALERTAVKKGEKVQRHGPPLRGRKREHSSLLLWGTPLWFTARNKPLRETVNRSSDSSAKWGRVPGLASFRVEKKVQRTCPEPGESRKRQSLRHRVSTWKKRNQDYELTARTSGHKFKRIAILRTARVSHAEELKSDAHQSGARDI